MNLEAAIKSLRDLADQCETSRDNIARYYTDDGDTLEKDGYREPEDFKAAVNTAVGTVRDRATTIETYKDKIVELNQSGGSLEGRRRRHHPDPARRRHYSR